MTIYSKAAKRRAKKAMPELAQTPRRKNRGRARMDELPKEREDEAQATVLTARARQMGLPPSKARDMNRVMLSDGAGMALSLLCDADTAARLWQHFVALAAAEARYHRSIGKSIYAKTAKIEMMQERFETRPDDAIDLRSEDERDRDAVTRWMRWVGLIGRLPAHSQSAIYSAYRRHVVLVDAAAQKPDKEKVMRTVTGVDRVTMAGRRFVDAMERLDAVL